MLCVTFQVLCHAPSYGASYSACQIQFHVTLRNTIHAIFYVRCHVIYILVFKLEEKRPIARYLLALELDQI